jgi:hypothetical protein
MCASCGFAAWVYLQSKYPGRGLQVIENIFKKTLSFSDAIAALKEGRRIRRRTERKGYTKVIITAGKDKKEKFGTYRIGDDDISDYCSFSLEDVLANDWIIDD